MKIEGNKFINTRKIVEYLGNDVATKFSQIHASAGSDTTSCYMLLVKLKCLNGKEKLRLLNTIGVSYKVSDKTVKCVEKLIQTIYYPGRIEESLTETRVWLHKQMKTKTFQPLPPGETSMLQAITRVHYQVFYSSWVDETIISNILLQGNGWIVDKDNEEVRPLWLTGTFSILFLHFYSSQQF